MKIEHLAIWVQDLEAMRAFYEYYFQARAGEKYRNEKKNFESYFLSFEGGPRLELMNRPDILDHSAVAMKEFMGLTHFAVSVGSKERVNSLTEELRQAGFTIAGEARTTGDGYYESVVLDPENNRIEITV